MLKNIKKRRTNKLGMLLVLTMILAMTFSYTVFATVTPVPGEIDTGTFTTIIDGAKQVLGLFSIFPINIFLAASILGIAIVVVKKVKKGS